MWPGQLKGTYRSKKSIFTFVDFGRKKYILFNEINCIFWTALFILQMYFREEDSNLKDVPQTSVVLRHNYVNTYFNRRFLVLS